MCENRLRPQTAGELPGRGSILRGLLLGSRVGVLVIFVVFVLLVVAVPLLGLGGGGKVVFRRPHRGRSPVVAAAVLLSLSILLLLLLFLLREVERVFRLGG